LFNYFIAKNVAVLSQAAGVVVKCVSMQCIYAWVEDQGVDDATQINVAATRKSGRLGVESIKVTRLDLIRPVRPTSGRAHYPEIYRPFELELINSELY
jgi:hypothetical protein